MRNDYLYDEFKKVTNLLTVQNDLLRTLLQDLRHYDQRNENRCSYICKKIVTVITRLEGICEQIVLGKAS